MLDNYNKFLEKRIIDTENPNNIYHDSLEDECWKEISDKFPKYNDPSSEDNAKAVEYIYNHIVDNYVKDINNFDSTSLKHKILDGIT